MFDRLDQNGGVEPRKPAPLSMIEPRMRSTWVELSDRSIASRARKQPSETRRVDADNPFDLRLRDQTREAIPLAANEIKHRPRAASLNSCVSRVQALLVQPGGHGVRAR
jgi:hypothetical protein